MGVNFLKKYQNLAIANSKKLDAGIKLARKRTEKIICKKV